MPVQLDHRPSQKPARLERRDEGPRLAAIGLESEFSLVLNGRLTKVEDIFTDPRDFMGRNLVHRVGTSFHLSTGGAVYFDTGVIEVATPVIEIERGCGARAGRSLWESISLVRCQLGEWEHRTQNTANLSGFSTHYNVSFGHRGSPRAVDQLALLLAYILPVPVILLAANRRSTGIGVRPRGNRIEVTADFTPSAPLMIATATLVTGIVREVMTWPSLDLRMLTERHVPVIEAFHPMPHTSRRGWLARFDCYPENPFTANIDDRRWQTLNVRSDHPDHAERLSLRQIGRRIFQLFRWPIGRVSDVFTLRLIASVLRGSAPSLLNLPDRPAAYDDVGRLCGWENLFPESVLARSRYERVLMRAISGAKLRIGGRVLKPTGMRGWSRVVFQDQHRTRHTLSIDTLLPHLDEWERG